MPEYHGWTHAPKAQGGTDPIPGATVSTPWIAVYDDLPYGQGISTASGFVSLQYPYIDWSDDAGGTFTYVRTASGLGASNNYQPKILADGIYSFTATEACESLGNGGKDFKIAFNLNVSGAYPGGNGGAPEVLRDEQWYANATDFSVAYFYFARTWVLPIKVGSGLTVVPSVSVIKTSADGSTWSATLRNRLFITYLGPLNHAASFSNHNDPYPTTP